MLPGAAILWVKAQGCAGLVREEHPMEFRNLGAKLCFGRPHVRILLHERAERSFHEPVAIADLDQPMANPARSPIAHSLPIITGDYIRHKALRLILPGHIWL